MALTRALMLSLLGTARGFGLLTPARRAGVSRAAVTMAADGPVCVVTGGSRGLGRSIALALGGEGCRVVVNYVNSAAAAEAVVEEIKGLGGDGIAVQADMSTLDGIKGLFKTTAETYDEPVGVLVNNAGITRDTLAMRMKEAQWNDVIQTNLNGCAPPSTPFLMRVVAPGVFSRSLARRAWPLSRARVPNVALTLSSLSSYACVAVSSSRRRPRRRS